MSSCVRFHINNYLDLSILANTFVSSAQAAFPITNAYNGFRRTKVWRSNGYFKVTSSNNAIVFREISGGPDLVAEITTDEYSSTATFTAAVKSALEAVGAATYTVTQDSNLKFNISSDLGGGATVFQLRCADAGFTATDLLGFDDTVHLTGASNYNADVLRINTGEFIRWDMGISTNPDSFFLIGARNRVLKFSPSAQIYLQGNETNNFTSPSFEQLVPYDDSVLALISDGGFHTEGLRYWQVTFNDQNPLGYLEIGAMSLANFYSPSRGGAQFPLSHDLIDRTTTIFSEGGQTFSDIKEVSAGFSLNWSAMTKQDKEDIEYLFEKVGTGIPFFLTLDSQAGFSSSVNRSIRYVKFSQAPKIQLVSPNNFTVSTEFEEQL